jgi:hypothetical protein
MNQYDVRKKNILLEDYQQWYVEGTDVRLNKVQEIGKNDIYIRSH